MRIQSVATATLVLVALSMSFITSDALPVAQNTAGQQKARILVGPNVLVSRENDAIVDELLVATDPINPQNLLASGNVFRTNHAHGQEETRAYYSRDRGSTWTSVVFPEMVTFGGGDAQVGYGRTGTGYFVALGGPPPGGHILFYRSEDGGVTWGKPVDVGQRGGLDHEQIVVDHTTSRFAGNVYLSTLDVEDRGNGKYVHHVVVFRSSDDGRTWRSPVEVSNSRGLNRGINSVNPLTFTDGELFVPFQDFSISDAPKPDDLKNHYWFATSQDGGSTFSSPHKLTMVNGGEITGVAYEDPAFGIDRSDGPFRDRVYIAWMDRKVGLWAEHKSYVDGSSDTHPARLLISYSSDRGKTWAEPKVVSASPRGEQFSPTAISVNNQGTLAVSWGDTRDNAEGRDFPLKNRYLAASVDGGESFLPAVRISSVSTDTSFLDGKLVGVETNGTSVSSMSAEASHGEYLGLTADTEGTFHALWTDGRTGRNQAWTAEIRVERLDRGTAIQTANVRELVDADVTDRVEAVLDPIREFPSAGSVEVPIRLKNKSDRSIYGPIKVEVLPFRTHAPDDPIADQVTILNSTNNKSGVGAVFDYSHALGDFESLPPGVISEGIVWRFKAPSNWREFPDFKFKVTARVEKAQSIDTPKPSNSR